MSGLRWSDDDGLDFSDCRRLWLAGRCPCCGGHLEEWYWQDEVHEPEPVAEGVEFCGRCIANEHAKDILPRMLEALLP